MKGKMRVLGIIWLAFLLLSYFIPVQVEGGANYTIKDSLLGILIGHNAFVLALYVLVGAGMISFSSIRKIKIK